MKTNNMKYALTFCAFLLTLDLFGKTYDADSIRIVGLQHDLLDGFSRHELLAFIDKVKTVPFDCDPSDTISMWINNYECAYVDTIINDKREISSLLDNIKRLKQIRKLSYNTSQCPLEVFYSRQIHKLFWDPELRTFYYMVLIVFSKERNEFIWLGADVIERGYKQYKLSSEYKSILSKYSEVYKE